MSKFTDPIYEPPPDSQTVARWNAERRREHKVSELESGFAFRASGRSGCIYYRENDKILELHWEMSGVDEYDVSLSLNGLREWALPYAEAIAPTKQQEILASLREWLVTNGVRARFEEPSI